MVSDTDKIVAAILAVGMRGGIQCAAGMMVGGYEQVLLEMSHRAQKRESEKAITAEIPVAFSPAWDPLAYRAEG